MIQPSQPFPSAMNDFHALNDSAAPHPAELCLDRLLGQTEDYIRREPVKAVAAAFGMGLLINVLPPRVIVGTVTGLGVALLRPALLTLGVVKAFELCCACKDESGK